MDALPGRATPEGTGRFADRGVRERQLPKEHFRDAPGGLRLSSFGLGTYLGRPDGRTDLAVEEAVTVSLASGRVNVVDTAINYRGQRAERSVGRALRRLVDRGSVARDEVFLSTKVGYLAPDAEAGEPARDWVERELIRPGALREEDLVDGSHAMTPSYLEDQVRRSRENLGVASVDLLYLHNAPDAQIARVGEEEFARRLLEAFATCERLRSAGTIGAYGLATWDSLRVPPGAEGHFDLGTAVRLAEEAGGHQHGFRFVQFPFNRSMPEAAAWPSQVVGPATVPLFEAARSWGLGCFTSVPLLQGQLARGTGGVRGLTPAQTALQFARSAPGNLGPLVGQKQPAHLAENLAVASERPWTESEFRSRLT